MPLNIYLKIYMIINIICIFKIFWEIAHWIIFMRKWIHFLFPCLKITVNSLMQLVNIYQCCALSFWLILMVLSSFTKWQNFVLFHYLDNFVGTFLTAKIQFDRLTRVDTNCTARNIVFLPFNWVTVGLHLLSGAISTQT